MDIRQVLALEANASSIKKIDQFLSSITPNHRDYPRALAHLAFLTYTMGDVSSSFQLLFNFLDICPSKEKPTIYNTLIEIYYNQKDYSNVFSMIENKKEYLPNYNQSAYYEDLIRYYQTIQNKNELIRVLLIYLDDDISDERRLKAMLILCKEYLADEDYHHFKEKNKVVQTLSISLNEKEIYHQAYYEEIYVCVKEGSYPKALNMIDEILEMPISKEIRSQAIALKLEVFVALGEYRRASIFEAEYESIVNEGSLEAKLNFAMQCIKLYDALKNRFNKNSYEERYNELLKEKNETLVVEAKPKKHKTFKQTLELNFLKEQNKYVPTETTKVVTTPRKDQFVRQEVVENRVEKIIKTTEATLIESASKLDDIATDLMKLNDMVFSQFRDYLRQLFIVLSKHSIFEDAYFLSKNITGKYFAYHYKKERLYDKKSESLSLNDSILIEAITSKEEVIVPHTKETSYYDVITNKLYKDILDTSVICFPLIKGALLFSSKTTDILTNQLNYETLKLGCAYLQVKWNSEQNEIELLKKYHDFSFIMEHVIAGYKRQIDNYVFLSKKTSEMFVSSEAISIQEFYTYVESQDLINYKKVINDLLTGKTKEASVRFRSSRTGKSIYYQEDFIIDEEGVILSIINDISDKVKEEEDAIFMAHYDAISGLYNESKLDYDLASLIESNKFSLLALKIKNYQNYIDIYGYDFASQLLYATGKFIKEYDKEITAYHMDGDKFVIALKDINDKRAVNKYARLLCEDLSVKLKKLNYRLNVYFEVGLLRYPTDMVEKNHRKLIDYLLSALTSAHDNSLKTTISGYNKEDYKRQFFQSQIVTHVSEAIDNNHLALYYRQIVDVNLSTCDHYKVSLNLNNFAVDSEVIYSVLEKRNMIKVVERYIIHKSLYELNEIYKSTKLYFTLLFEISKETLADPTFKDYVLEQIKFFNIPKTAVIIEYSDTVDKEILEHLKSLAISDIKISTKNLDILKQMPISHFYYELEKDVKVTEDEFITVLKTYCDKRNTNFVLDGVNNKAMIAHFVEANISLYGGKVYSALLSMQDIIKTYLS